MTAFEWEVDVYIESKVRIPTPKLGSKSCMELCADFKRQRCLNIWIIYLFIYLFREGEKDENTELD